VSGKSPNDSNGVPLEPTDLQKAAAYPNAWACITGSNGNGAAGVSLGATAFIYGNKNDFGGAWFNDEYATAMTKRLSYYSQYKMYQGIASTGNQPPACQSMTLSQTANVTPSGTFTQTGPQTFEVTAPDTAGVWKINVYAFDGHNNVGIASASFAVQ
jgi:hypothetical protein